MLREDGFLEVAEIGSESAGYESYRSSVTPYFYISALTTRRKAKFSSTSVN